MNHRQWKKNFKKLHGRNPLPEEDKKISSREINIILDGLKTVFERVREAVEEAAKRFIIIAESVQRMNDNIIETRERLEELEKEDERLN